jgi:hypothetical protein
MLLDGFGEPAEKAAEGASRLGVTACAPASVTDGSLTENLNKTAVRLWTDRSFVKAVVVVEHSDLS